MTITTEQGQLAHNGCLESWIVKKDETIIGHIERLKTPNRGTFVAYALGDSFIGQFSGLHARSKVVALFQ